MPTGNTEMQPIVYMKDGNTYTRIENCEIGSLNPDIGASGVMDSFGFDSVPLELRLNRPKMSRKRACKMLMGIGLDRNTANAYLRTVGRDYYWAYAHFLLTGGLCLGGFAS